LEGQVLNVDARYGSIVVAFSILTATCLLKEAEFVTKSVF